MMSIAFRDMEIDGRLARLTATEGLDAGCMETSVEQYAGMDGGRVSGSRMGARTVRLIYSIVGDPEEARARLYEVFEPKRSGTLRITTRDKDVTARAVVGEVDCDPWSRKEELTVTLTCPDPWLYSVEERTYQPDNVNQWTITRNRGASVGFVAQVGRAGYVRFGGETRKLQWDASSVLAADAVLTLDMREGHRDLYIESGGARTSYLQYITEWYWQTCPHLPEGRQGIVRSNGAAKDPLAIRERWAGI